MIVASAVVSLALHFLLSCPFFFFQAEDGIRDLYVTGVQTCALPISRAGRRSAHYWEHEMGDAVALNADRWVAEQHVVSRELAEEGAVALAHHDRDEVDGHLVEQPEVQALPGDGASGDRDDAVASEHLRTGDCGRYTVGHEGERCLGVCVDPVGRGPGASQRRPGRPVCANPASPWPPRTASGRKPVRRVKTPTAASVPSSAESGGRRSPQQESGSRPRRFAASRTTGRWCCPAWRRTRRET